MTELTPVNGNPIQLYGQSLPPQLRSKHRAWIAVRVEALLDGYWQSRPTEAVKMEMLREWMEGLEAFTESEIRAACTEWNNVSGQRKPRVGDIRGLILSKRAEALRSAPKPVQAATQDRVTAKTANSILEEVGFSVRKFGGAQ